MKKLVALFILVSFISVNILAQAQPTKIEKKEKAEKVEKKIAEKKAEKKIEKKIAIKKAEKKMEKYPESPETK